MLVSCNILKHYKNSFIGCMATIPYIGWIRLLPSNLRCAATRSTSAQFDHKSLKAEGLATNEQTDGASLTLCLCYTYFKVRRCLLRYFWPSAGVQ